MIIEDGPMVSVRSGDLLAVARGVDTDGSKNETTAAAISDYFFAEAGSASKLLFSGVSHRVEAFLRRFALFFGRNRDGAFDYRALAMTFS